MRYVRKTFRWGLSVLQILHHFSTPELKALLKYCRRLIRDYCNAAYEGEGYCASIITFEMFEYGFVLAYDYDEEEWILNVVMMPDFDDPHCRRKRPRDDISHERISQILKDLEGHDWSWLTDNLWMLYRSVVPLLMLFIADTKSGIAFDRVFEMLRKTHALQLHEQRASHVISLFRNLDGEQSHDCRGLVPLSRARVSDAVSFLGPLWFQWTRLDRVSFDGLWDVSLFGALPEQANG